MTIIITRSEATAEIARVGGHYAVQGHSKSLIYRYQLGESPYATSYQSRVNDTNLHHISHPLPDIAQL